MAESVRENFDISGNLASLIRTALGRYLGIDAEYLLYEVALEAADLPRVATHSRFMSDDLLTASP